MDLLNIDACASIAADGQQVFITVISHDTVNTRIFDFSIKNASIYKHVRSVVLIPENFEIGCNAFGKVEKELTVNNKKVKMVMPPGSIASLSFDLNIR